MSMCRFTACSARDGVFWSFVFHGHRFLDCRPLANDWITEKNAGRRWTIQSDCDIPRGQTSFFKGRLSQHSLKTACFGHSFSFLHVTRQVRD